MKKKQLFFVFLSLLITFAAAYSEEAPKDTSKEKAAEEVKAAPEKEKAAEEVKAEPKVDLIVVDGTPIDRTEVLDGLRYSLRFNKAISQDDFDKTLEAIEDYLVDITLVDNAAKAKNVTVTDEAFEAEYKKMCEKISQTREGFLDSLKQKGLEEAKFKETFRSNVIRNEFLKETIEPQVNVTEEEAKAFYDANQQLMTQPENVVVSHILIKVNEGDDEKKKTEKKAQIEDIRSKIVKGESFEKMAKNFSDCPSSRNNGSLGKVFKGQTVEEFEETAYKLEVGEISNVIETKFGYHILKVTEKNPETVTPFEEAKDSIIDHLKKPKRKEIFGKFMEDLRAKADVKVYEELQPKYEECIPEDRRAKEEAPVAEEGVKKEEAPKADVKEEAKPKSAEETKKDAKKDTKEPAKKKK